MKDLPWGRLWLVIVACVMLPELVGKIGTDLDQTQHMIGTIGLLIGWWYMRWETRG